ncbi:hypothetical protein [Pseudoalteromonas piscicida]
MKKYLIGVVLSFLIQGTAIADVAAELRKPYRYIGEVASQTAKQLKVDFKKPSFKVETGTHSFLFESRDDKISYVAVDFHDKAGCRLQDEFDSRALLFELGISTKSLDLASKRTDSHKYYDHTNKLKITASCLYDGGMLSVSFSQKYYLY